MSALPTLDPTIDPVVDPLIQPAETPPGRVIDGEAVRRTVVRNAAAVTAARIISSAALFGWSIVLARLLGAGEFGIYGTITSLFSIAVAFAGFSMSLIVIREVAVRRDLPGMADRIAGAQLAIATVAAGLAFVGLNAAAWAGGFPPEIRALMAIAGLSLFADTFGTLAYDQLLAHEKMVATSAIDLIHLFLRIGLAIVVLAVGGGLLGVYVVTILTGAGRAAALWAFLRRIGVRPRFPVDPTIRRMLLIGSLPLVLSAAINTAYAQIDTPIIARLLGNADAGNLRAAFLIIVGVVEILSTTVLTALYPALSRAAAEPNAESFREGVHSLAVLTALISLPMGLIFTAYGGQIMGIFGPSFAGAGDVVRALIWYAVTTMIGNVFQQALFAQGRQRRVVAVRAGGLAFKLALNFAFIPLFGVVGAALASVVAEIGVLAFLSRGFAAIAAGRVLRIGAAFAIGAAALVIAGRVFWLMGIAAGGLAYAGAVLFLRVLAPPEWAILRRLLAALPGRE